MKSDDKDPFDWLFAGDELWRPLLLFGLIMVLMGGGLALLTAFEG